jgi:hypothetical protein
MGQLRFEPDHEPAAMEDRVEVEFVHIVIAIEWLRETVSLLDMLKEPPDPSTIIHRRSVRNVRLDLRRASGKPRT